MQKGDWVVRVSVKNAETYPDYLAAAKPVFEKYGARFMVRGGRYRAMEGIASMVVVVFRSRLRPDIDVDGDYGPRADEILELARETGVPVRTDNDLLELLAVCELGEEIPSDLFTAVAELLAYLYRVNGELGGS